MTVETLIFWAFALLTAGGGLMLALTKNVIYAAFTLFIVLFGMGAMYVFAGAEFLAVSQVIVYVGGILVILLFGVMLTHKIREVNPRTEIVNLFPGLLAAGALFGALLLLIRETAPQIALAAATHPPAAAINDVHQIGKATLTHYLLPFELVSILLLIVLVGAAYLTRKAHRKEANA
ncbi:MAG: NADH-quinone oxidoreductase subunit J [Bacteroidota bacterium]